MFCTESNTNRVSNVFHVLLCRVGICARYTVQHAMLLPTCELGSLTLAENRFIRFIWFPSRKLVLVELYLQACIFFHVYPLLSVVNCLSFARNCCAVLQLSCGPSLVTTCAYTSIAGCLVEKMVFKQSMAGTKQMLREP